MSADVEPLGAARAPSAAAPDPAVIELDPDPSAVRSARAFVMARCRAAGAAQDDCDTAVLLTSEVVTNAVLHGRSLARLSFTTAAGPAGTTLRVEVRDDNSRHPVDPGVDPDALDGRGIAVVDLLSSAWGVRDEPLGKTVWFEVLSPARQTGLGGGADAGPARGA